MGLSRLILSICVLVSVSFFQLGNAVAGPCQDAWESAKDASDAQMYACAGECKDTYLGCDDFCQGLFSSLVPLCEAKCESDGKSCVGWCRRVRHSAVKAAKMDYKECLEAGVCAIGTTFDPELNACCPDAIYVADCLCEEGSSPQSVDDYDENGCLLGYGCECVPNCPLVLCMEGYEPADLDNDGCKDECAPVVEQCMSNADCGAGEVCSVSNGDCQMCADCPMCAVCCGECVPSQVGCGPNDCGPPLGMPNYECPDGETIAGPGDCVEQEDGACGWDIVFCPDGCAVGGMWYEVGDSWLDEDGCNQCSCAEGGDYFCTDMACPVECTGDQVWNDCGSACTATCDDPNPACILVCVPKCECPSAAPLWDGTQCIKESDCGSACPDGTNPVQCFVAPCMVSDCPAYPNAECVDNYCGGCFADYYVNGQMVDCTVGTMACEEDEDCPQTHWCRPTADSNSIPVECVPYVGEDEFCGGFIPYYMLEKCDPSLVCTDMNPLMMDEPGVCLPPSPVTCEYGGMVYQEGDSFPGIGNDWCNTCFCDEGGFVACTEMACGPEYCQDDTDCPATDWCRQAADGTFECVPYVDEGDSCGGFTLPWYYEKCLPGLTCAPQDPMIPDLPGICTGPAVNCEYGGMEYEAGDTFSGVGSDWCNSCFCGDGGEVGCTKMFCGPQSCETDDDCAPIDWCRQAADGTFECVPYVGEGESCGGFTLPWYYEKCLPGLACESQDPMIPDLPGICTGDGVSCEYGGETYQPGDSFPGTGDNWCNSCFCGDEGDVGCTLMLCPPVCPDGTQPVQCFVAPCDVSECPAYPNAVCEDNYCGGCFADYYMDGEMVDCNADMCADFVGPCSKDAECGEGQVCSMEGCNPSACGCDPATGDIMCTMDCGGGVCVDGGTPSCEPGTVSVADDLCNTCLCQDGGTLNCTKKGCSDPCDDSVCWSFLDQCDGGTGSSFATCDDGFMDCMYAVAAQCDLPPPEACYIGGCSSQVCSSQEGVITTCEWMPEYACYQDVGECGSFGPGGQCAWNPTEELQQCLAAAGDGSPSDGTNSTD